MIVPCISIALSRNYEEFILVFKACTYVFRYLRLQYVRSKLLASRQLYTVKEILHLVSFPRPSL